MPTLSHPWPTEIPETIALQQELRAHVRIENDFAKLKSIAGVDVGYDIETDQCYAIAVLMQLDELKPHHIVRAQEPTTFPYVPGLLSFREIPVVLRALKALPEIPDMVLVDGQGIAHPRRLGIAAHLGVLTGLPTIGVAKSRLTGRHAEPGPTAGDFSLLMDKEERIGTVLRSKTNCLPLFISPGHRVDQPTAARIVMQCLKGYRLPEPTRIADKYSKRAEREKIPLA